MATGKEWRKRFVIIETSEQYPKKICFALWNENIDKCAQQLEIGRQITAHIDIESREFNGRWYTEARAWRVDSQGVAHQAQPATSGATPPQQSRPASAMNGDDLPF